MRSEKIMENDDRRIDNNQNDQNNQNNQNNQSKEHNQVEDSNDIEEKGLAGSPDETMKDHSSEVEDDTILDDESGESGKSEEDEVKRLEGELHAAKDKYLRLYSEFENFRRRTAREKLEMLNTANQELIADLLPVIDDFERAEESLDANQDLKHMREGVSLIYQKIMKILQQKGLKSMDTKKGSGFDAELHEAITQIPAPKKSLKGKVVDTIEKGYYLGEKVIRHARVVIGN